MDPSSCPVATKQQFIKKVMQLNSAFSGASILVTKAISFASHNLIVLSSEHVIIFGSSGTLSVVNLSIFSGSKQIILKIGP